MSFLGASLSPEEVVIVTELMAGGTLWRALKTGKVTFYRRQKGGRSGCVLGAAERLLVLQHLPARLDSPVRPTFSAAVALAAFMGLLNLVYTCAEA